jgi:hypothetical protein
MSLCICMHKHLSCYLPRWSRYNLDIWAPHWRTPTLRGVDHTIHFWHHMPTSLAVIVWKVVGQHLFMYIVSNNFMVGIGREVWCDRNMRGWSHQPIQIPSINNSNYNNVKSDGPTSIFVHSSQQFHDWNQTKSLVWLGHEGLIPPASSDTHPSASLVVIVWKAVGRHLVLNIIPNKFMVGTRQEVWCDQGMSPDNFNLPISSICPRLNVSCSFYSPLHIWK